jgi:hypothetical protein
LFATIDVDQDAAMQCNIDARGKRVRFISGVAATLAGLVLLLLAALGVGPSGWMWALAALLLISGAFQIFEARAGWCAVRAMGFRTPV